MMPPRPRPPEDNVDSWLMSYADMITLLLCFFIIFVSVSEPKKDKMTAIAEGMANKFGAVDMSTPFQTVSSSVAAVMENRQLLRDISFTKTQNSVSMDLSTVAFYKPGSADFREEMLPALTELAAALKTGAHADYRIEVEGYTSDVPVEGYPSNWEFSAVRAAHMVRFLIAQGIDPDRLSAIGYGSTQALVPNSDQDGQPILENRAKNERVIIKLEKAL